jgi:hypothetical protein
MNEEARVEDAYGDMANHVYFTPLDVEAFVKHEILTRYPDHV